MGIRQRGIYWMDHPGSTSKEQQSNSSTATREQQQYQQLFSLSPYLSSISLSLSLCLSINFESLPLSFCPQQTNHHRLIKVLKIPLLFLLLLLILLLVPINSRFSSPSSDIITIVTSYFHFPLRYEQFLE